MMPVSPAIRNWKRKATQNIIGIVKRIFPPHMVPSQLKILIPVGTAIAMVDATKNALAYEVIPMVNMWCAHTPRLMKPMHSVAATMMA